MRTLALFMTVSMVGAGCVQPDPDASPEEGARKAPAKKAAPAKKTDEADTPAGTPSADGDHFDPPQNVAAPPEDATTTDSGLAYKMLEKGEGDIQPGPNDRVTVHYTGWTTDGKMFDSSHKRGRPATFGLNQVIAGWTEGLQKLAVGDRARLWIPEALAYKGKPGRPQGMLVFDVELLKVQKAPRAPEDVAAPPADAQKTDSGLAYKVLESGADGGEKPGPTSRVKVHYSGWTTDGKMFDSSRVRGQPATFPLNGVIKGWTEGLQLMKEGATYRFWIPAELAYENRPGRPQGTLVFDVELLEVVSN
jgi:peptidylprolyl isomerase